MKPLHWLLAAGLGSAAILLATLWMLDGGGDAGQQPEEQLQPAPSRAGSTQALSSQAGGSQVPGSAPEQPQTLRPVSQPATALETLTTPNVIGVVDPWGDSVPTAVLSSATATPKSTITAPLPSGPGLWLIADDDPGPFTASTQGWGEATWDPSADTGSADHPGTIILGQGVAHWGQLLDSTRRPLSGERLRLTFEAADLSSDDTEEEITALGFGGAPVASGAFQDSAAWLNSGNRGVVVDTGHLGRFPCSEPARLSAAQFGGQAASHLSRIVIESREPLVLVSSHALPFTVTFLTAHGAPLAGPAQVELAVHRDQRSQNRISTSVWDSSQHSIPAITQAGISPPRVLTLDVDERGRGTFDMVHPGGSTISARLNNLIAGPVDVHVGTTDGAGAVTMQLHPPRWITGKVVDQSSQPIAGAWLTLHRPGQPLPDETWPRGYDLRQALPSPPPSSAIELTDTDGRFRIAAQTGALYVRRRGFLGSQMPARALKKTMTIVLTRGATITGRVLVDGEAPQDITALTVRALSEQTQREHIAPIDEHGSFTLTGLPPGMSSLRVYRAGTVLVDRPVGLVAGRTRQFDLDISTWRPLDLVLTGQSGLVTDVSLEPVAKPVSWNDHTTQRRTIKPALLHANGKGLIQGAVNWTGPTTVFGTLHNRRHVVLGRIHILSEQERYAVQLPRASLQVSVRSGADDYPVRVMVQRLRPGDSPTEVTAAKLTPAQPSLNVQHLLPGDYMIHSPSHGLLTPRVVTVGPSSGSAHIELTRDNRLLRCVLTEADGDPAAQLVLQSWMGGQLISKTTTDKYGEADLALPRFPDSSVIIRVRPEASFGRGNGIKVGESADIPVPTGTQGTLRITLP